MDKRYDDKAGFTLIEIIVSLLIASIAMMIAGSLILNAMGYFDKTAVSDSDKQCLEGISSFMSKELIYASEVKIAQTSDQYPSQEEDNDPDQAWHWFSIEDGYLYYDGKKSFNDGYYGHRTLQLIVKGYDAYRMDVHFQLVDTQENPVYTTNNTWELLNLKVYKQKNHNFDPFKNNTMDVDLNKNAAARIYYRKGMLPMNLETQNDYTGTVEDEKFCMRDAGEWDAEANYSIGDFVTYQGAVYRCIKGNGVTQAPGSNQDNSWKKLERYWSLYSSYTVNDVIIHKDTNENDAYFQCIKEIQKNSEDKEPIAGKQWSKYWKVIDEDKLNEIIKAHQSSSFCDVEDTTCDNYKILTVGDELCEKSSVVSDLYSTTDPVVITTNNKGDFEDHVSDYQKFYIVGDFVYYKGYYWRKVMAPDTANITPGIGVARWKKIDDQWDSDSLYEKGDVIIYQQGYYRCMIEFSNQYDPTVSTVWEKVVWDNTSDSWIKE